MDTTGERVLGTPKVVAEAEGLIYSASLNERAETHSQADLIAGQASKAVLVYLVRLLLPAEIERLKYEARTARRAVERQKAEDNARRYRTDPAYQKAEDARMKRESLEHGVRWDAKHGVGSWAAIMERRATKMAADREAARLRSEEDERNRAARHKCLSTAVAEAVARVREHAVDEFAAELLSSVFRLPSGQYVSWGDATVEQHEVTAQAQRLSAVNNLSHIARHEAAVELIRREGKANLSETSAAEEGPTT